MASSSDNWVLLALCDFAVESPLGMLHIGTLAGTQAWGATSLSANDPPLASWIIANQWVVTFVLTPEPFYISPPRI